MFQKLLVSIFGFVFIGNVFASQVNDLQTAKWGESIRYLLIQGIIQGYPDGSYKPQKKINRAEFTKIVVGAMLEDQGVDLPRKDCFPDVIKSDWFSSYVCYAKENNIIQGYPDGTFKPGQYVNQAEALKILYEAFNRNIEPSEGAWYQTYLDAAESDGLLYFNPDSPASSLITREEMAYFTAGLLDEAGEISEKISREDFYGKNYDTSQ